MAQQKMMVTHQGSTEADEYVLTFRDLHAEARWDEASTLIWFKRGFNPQLRRKITSTFPVPATPEEWYQRAIYHDREWRQEKKEEELWSKTQVVAKKEKKKEPSTTAAAPMASKSMCLFCHQKPTYGNYKYCSKDCAVKARGQKDPNAKEIDAARCGPIKCYKCNCLGHIARDCKSKLDIRAMTYDQMLQAMREESAQDFLKESQ
ncbi:hypothetical protein K474DRAFT_1712339 [Panus rudis PR-1116 ss-1]|nr:hypothetical protein K474DRAFT_1712339 [Panus rudis PR-1116 ss-1]